MELNKKKKVVLKISPTVKRGGEESEEIVQGRLFKGSVRDLELSILQACFDEAATNVGKISRQMELIDCFQSIKNIEDSEDNITLSEEDFNTLKSTYEQMGVQGKRNVLWNRAINIIKQLDKPEYQE